MIPMFPPKKAAYLDELDEFLGWAKKEGVTITDGRSYLSRPGEAAPAKIEQPAKPEDQEPAQ